MSARPLRWWMTSRTSSGFGLVGAFPRLAEQPRLVVGRQRRRLADVDVGRAQAKDRADDGVDDVARRHDEQAHAVGRWRSASATTSESSRRSYLVGARRLAGVLFVDVDVEQPRRHHDDVAVAWRAAAPRPRARARADCAPAPARCRGGPRSDRARVRRRAAGRTCRRPSATATAPPGGRAVNQSARTPMRARRRDRGDVAGRDHRQRRSPPTMAAGTRRPSGSSRPPRRGFPGALNGACPARRAPEPGERRNRRARSITRDAIA